MSKEEAKNNITDFLNRYAFQLIGALITIVNLYLASQLAPLITKIEVINQRIDSVVQSLTDREYIPRKEYEAGQSAQEREIEGIRQNNQVINDKLDRLLQKGGS